MELAMTRLAQAAPAISASELAKELAPRLVEQLLASKLWGLIALGEDAVLPPEAAGAAINRSVSTLEVWRSRGIGPTAIRIGPRSIGYTVGNLRRFLRDAEAVGNRNAAASASGG
jgi:hypothetical protein